MNCQQLNDAVELELQNSQFINDNHELPWYNEPAAHMEYAKYYRGLAACVKILKAKNVLEIGCATGHSAASLARYANKVTTCDIEDVRNHNYKQIQNINFILLDKPEQCLNFNWSEFDFIYLDIGLHDGKYEKIIHEQLEKTYNGFVGYDDICWDDMIPLWDSIQQDKIEVDWHGHWNPITHSLSRQCFGLVRYRK